MKTASSPSVPLVDAAVGVGIPECLEDGRHLVPLDLWVGPRTPDVEGAVEPFFDLVVFGLHLRLQPDGAAVPGGA